MSRLFWPRFQTTVYILLIIIMCLFCRLVCLSRLQSWWIKWKTWLCYWKKYVDVHWIIFNLNFIAKFNNANACFVGSSICLAGSYSAGLFLVFPSTVSCCDMTRFSATLTSDLPWDRTVGRFECSYVPTVQKVVRLRWAVFFLSFLNVISMSGSDVLLSANSEAHKSNMQNNLKSHKLSYNIAFCLFQL